MAAESKPTSTPAPQWRPKHNPWLVALTVTLATFMEVLDTSIANVSLPHIAGALGASQDEATWVLTCYLVSNAIVLPISAYIASIVGRKRFYMSCVALFGISSFLCGIAVSLPQLLIFRVLQGIGGGGLAPSEQAILADTFEPSKRGQAFAIYGLAVVAAPAIGPTLGGWITDNYDWRWIFFINIPVAILSMLLTHRMVEDPPHVVEEVKRSKRGKLSLDYVGFGFVALAFGSLEVVMDKGQEDDWFSSSLISGFTAFTIIGFVGLIAWELYQVRVKRKPILDLRLFKNRTFALSFGMMFVLGAVLYGTTVLIPQFLQTILGYTAESAGMALSTGGLVTMCCMPICGKLIGKVDPRYLLVFGFTIMGIALVHMTTLNLGISFEYAAQLRAIQALGLAFLFVPINTMAYTDIPREKNNDVSGLINVARNIGGSVGTALLTTMYAREQQKHQTYLVGHLNSDNPALTQRLSSISNAFMSHGSTRAESLTKAYTVVERQLGLQASVLSYVDIIDFFSIIVFAMVPLVFLMKKRKIDPTSEVAAH